MNKTCFEALDYFGVYSLTRQYSETFKEASPIDHAMSCKRDSLSDSLGFLADGDNWEMNRENDQNSTNYNDVLDSTDVFSNLDIELKPKCTKDTIRSRRTSMGIYGMFSKI